MWCARSRGPGGVPASVIGRGHRRAVVVPPGSGPRSRRGRGPRPRRHRRPGPPHSRRPAGRTTRPWRSRSTSKAPAKMKREKVRASSVRDRLGGDARRQLLSHSRGNSRQAVIEPARDIGAAVELRAEPRGDRHPSLVVHRVPVLAGEHPSLAPRCPDQSASSRPAGPAGTREPSEVASPLLASRAPHSVGCGGPQGRLVHLYSPLRATLGHVGGIIHRADPPSTRFCTPRMGKRSGATRQRSGRARRRGGSPPPRARAGAPTWAAPQQARALMLRPYHHHCCCEHKEVR